ncbi:MAG TPA: nuclear transport factor 2 family protein [Archangium sp.]|jgi:ketosteroid isomerase-like protein|uniref:nuclear transport factor 2 family protein n=1 Tax=Archangium sp. TaxID=1872627 RepID=UPI002EDA9735
MKTETENLIKATMQGFAEAWRAGDVDKVMKLWDLQNPEMTYVPVDNNELIRDPKALKAYFDSELNGFTVTSAEMLEPVIRMVNDEYAYGFCLYQWAFESATVTGTLRSRATCLLRKQGQRWYYLHMHESVEVKG